MLTLDAESQRLLSSLRRPVTARDIREGRAETWHIFAVAKNNTALQHVEQGFGNAEQLFERLRLVSSGVHVALARLQVGRGLAQYLKFFAVYYDPDAGAEDEDGDDDDNDETKPAGSSAVVGRSKGGPVSNHKVGLKKEVFATFGPSVIPFSAYGPVDLKLELFSDKVFGYGRMSSSAEDNEGADASGGGGGGGGGAGPPSVKTLARQSAVFEKFTGRRRRRAKTEAPESSSPSSSSSATTAPDGSAAAAAAAAAAPTSSLVFEAEPDSGDGDGYGFVPIHMHRPGRIDIAAAPLSAEFFHNIASDHCVFLVDVSEPMLQRVRLHERRDLSPKLVMVLMDTMRMTNALQRVNNRALLDVMWFHGSGFGSWQLDPESWGEAMRDLTSLANFVQSMISEMELAQEACANGEDDPELIPTFSNQGCIAAMTAALGKRDVASVHLVVDGSHTFERELPVAIHDFKTQHGGRCPPVHVTAIDPPHLKVRSDVGTAETSGVSVPNQAAVTNLSTSGADAAAESSTLNSRQQQVRHRMQSNESCGFLRNVCSLSGGRYVEIGGFVEPTRLEAMVERVKRTVGPWLPKFLWPAASQE